MKDLNLDEAFAKKDFRSIVKHLDQLLDDINFNREYARRLVKAEELGLPKPSLNNGEASKRKRRLVVSKCTHGIINKLNLQEEMFNLKLQVYKLELETGEKYELDHVYPICGHNFTGLHVPWNLQPLLKLENAKKYNKVPEQWELEKKINKLLGELD